MTCPIPPMYDVYLHFLHLHIIQFSHKSPDLHSHISMAMTILPQVSTSLAKQKLGSCQASKVDPLIITKVKYHGFRVPTQNLLGAFSAGFLVHNYGSRRKTNVAVHASVPPEAPVPSDPSPAHWKFWVLGAIMTIFLNFSKGKWGPLLKLKEKVETTIDEAEQLSNIVEEVAEKVEKGAEEAAEHLPQGKLQGAAQRIEEVAAQIDKDAQIAGDALEKMKLQVEDMEKEVDSILESTIHQEKTVMTADSEGAKDK